MEKIILIGTQAALDAKKGLLAKANDFDVKTFAFDPAAFGRGFFGRIGAKRQLKRALALQTKGEDTIILLDDPQSEPWPFWMAQYLQGGITMIGIPKRLETTYSLEEIERSGFCVYDKLDTPDALDDVVRGALFRAQSFAQRIR